MGVSKPIHEVLLLVSIFSIRLSYCIQSNTILCPEIEKDSLLTFKKSLKDPKNLLSSWDVEADCCTWKGVVCNNSTGHVHQLHLQGKHQEFGSGLSGKLNPSLLNLKHLNLLDLSNNLFDGHSIPSFIGSFTNLQHLDLSFSRFEGIIPPSIGNLSNLLTLRLEDDVFSGRIPLYVDSLEWLLGLSKLEYLGMDAANLSRATNWAEVINSLPSLLEIHLSCCSLDFHRPPKYVNLTSLTFLDLSFNNYVYFIDSYISIPQWLFQLRNLIFLDLCSNNFQGSIPIVSNATKIRYLDMSGNLIDQDIADWIYFCKYLEFLDLSGNQWLPGEISNSIGNLTSLQSLDLSGNHLSGKLPREITNLCRLKSLDLSSNIFDGEVHDSFGNMSDCFLGSLEVLKLSENQLFGHLVDQFGEFKSLQTLDLRSNSLLGEIPATLGGLRSLKELFVDHNNLTGNLPQSLGQLFNLEIVFIDNNKLEGVVTETHFTNLSNLKTFSASGNHLTLNVGLNWTPPFQLYNLGLGSWSIGSDIPSWLRRQMYIHGLDLSNTGISGSIPSRFYELCFLNLSHNHLDGKIPHSINTYSCSIQRVYLSYNKLSGSLPQIGYNTVIELDLSYNSLTGSLSSFLCDTTNEIYQLQLLLLEGNRFNGDIPDCWKKWPSLRVLKLGNNAMSGSIPNSIGLLTSLVSLSLYDNKLSGKIPSTMHNCTNLRKIDLSRNNLDGNIPTWMGTSLVYLKFLILHSNKLSGEISSEICHLQELQILDLSNNQFSGIIPWCVCNFSAMATERKLEFESFEHGSGTIYGPPNVYYGPLFESASVMTKGVLIEYSTILSLVTNIDLSSNNLSGDIPKELTSLVELKSLNLSGNHLTGLIPESIGDMKQLESLDFSKNCLSGQIPNGFKLLSSLSHLNLSLNKLTGRIPESTQFWTFEASSFMGNNLCGPPLTSNCSGYVPVQKENGGDKPEIEWLYILLGLGYAVGFSAVCSVLVLKKSWRDAYFGFLECIWNKLYVYYCIKWNRLTKAASAS